MASGSPRRSELLALTGWPFEAVAADVDERLLSGVAAADQVARLAGDKALAARHVAGEGQVVVAADTLVVLEEQVLGKPKDGVEARRMLQQLRGRTHRVVTGLAVMAPGSAQIIMERCDSSVPMRGYTQAEIDRYLERGSPLDKAGAYAIQDTGFAPVERQSFRDCFANVMGLPLCHLTRAVRALDMTPPVDVPAACQEHLGYECPVYKEILN